MERTQAFIHTDYIQLDQLLKLEGVIMTGGQIKPLLEDGLIFVNGQPCTEKRKKLYPKDVVMIQDVGEWVIRPEEA